MGLAEGWYSQQDNDQKHIAHVVKERLLYDVPFQLYSPTQSADLNPIEYLWYELDRHIRKRTIKNKRDLKNALLQEWGPISKLTQKNLFSQ